MLMVEGVVAQRVNSVRRVSSRRTVSRVLGAVLAGSLALATHARPEARDEAESRAAFEAAVRAYDVHVDTLANPFMEGRLPGTRGMEVASQYMEYYFKEAGLLPLFDLVVKEGEQETRTPRASWRQPFPLGSSTSVSRGDLSATRGATKVTFERDEDFVVTGLGTSGSVRGQAVFVGYAINDGPDGYETFTDDVDLTGKVAVMLRFEPMDAEGKSRWGGRPWTGRAGFAGKITALKAKQPSAIVVVNPPGADDPRTKRLSSADGGSRPLADVPVFMMTAEAGDRLVQAMDAQGRSLMDLRRLADEKGTVIDLTGEVALDAQVESKPLIAENVGGVIPGRGALADEYVLIGAHLDHLGMGAFGSRSGPGALHPGADDNASGSAALILLAESLSEAYAQLPTDAPARSIAIVAFSGEESGLNGSRHYVNSPVVPLDKHQLMINFDMIGRIVNKRLKVAGTGTAENFETWLSPFFEATELEIVQVKGNGGGSDQLSFYQKDVPILFGIIADFHQDYHTPADTSDKLNREDAVRTAELFHEIAFAAATKPERFVFSRPSASGDAQAGPSLGQIKVRMGVMPGNYEDETPGVLIQSVTPGGAAEEGGLKGGDRIVTWNAEPVKDVASWMRLLSKHEPGDIVKVGIVRDGKNETFSVQLKAARPATGG
ncbi:MAG: M28 family peptidase [Planctomycetota bacterium]|nr:M28 family peptidase [Planctomycetota bacterium]